MSTGFVLNIASREGTDRLGMLIASELEAGDVVGLTGDLGAGKTYLAGSIAHALGIPKNVPIVSPTFTLIKEYHQGRLPVYHMDLYRLADPGELYELGLWEYYDGDGVSLVEWSNLFDDLWPEHALVVAITFDEGEGRTIELAGMGRGNRLAARISANWSRNTRQP